MKSHSSNQSIVRLYIADQGYFQGSVSSMTPSGITVDFSADDHPDVPIGQSIELAISSERLSSSLRLPALPRTFEANSERRRYFFEIELSVQMALRALIDGRNECRVTPNVVNPILVMMRQKSNDLYIEGTLEDASGAGMSVTVQAECFGALNENEPTRVSFSIPGDRNPVQLSATYRHSKIVNGQTRFGFEFTEGLNETNEHDLARFRRYVGSLKDELLSHLRACSAFSDDAA